MSTSAFRNRRASGRSNQQVIVELVRGQQPGTVFTYSQLVAALSEECDRVFTRQDVQQIVRLAKFRLLREYKRTLANVPNVGYQLAHAKEHLGIANGHTKRGQRQLRKALTTLENARLDEMTTQERDLHTAQCAINSALYHAQRTITSKQYRQDALIATLTSRVEQLEARGIG